MIIYAIVMLIVLPVAAFAFGLCRAAAKPVPRIQTIGRRSYAEGRPTMPSTPEPEDERARRRAPIYNWPLRRATPNEVKGGRDDVSNSRSED